MKIKSQRTVIQQLIFPNYCKSRQLAKYQALLAENIIKSLEPVLSARDKKIGDKFDAILSEVSGMKNSFEKKSETNFRYTKLQWLEKTMVAIKKKRSQQTILNQVWKMNLLKHIFPSTLYIFVILMTVSNTFQSKVMQVRL